MRSLSLFDPPERDNPKSLDRCALFWRSIVSRPGLLALIAWSAKRLHVSWIVQTALGEWNDVILRWLILASTCETCRSKNFC